MARRNTGNEDRGATEFEMPDHPDPGRLNAARAVGIAVREAREFLGLSQTDVANLTSGRNRVSRAAISDIERGRCLPGLDTLIALSSVLFIDPNEVLEQIRLSATVPVGYADQSLAELHERAIALHRTGDHRAALAIYDAMLDRFILDPPAAPDERRRLRAKIEIERATTLRRCGALKSADASAKRATQLAVDFQDLQAMAYIVLASVYSLDGWSILAGDAADRAVALAESGDDRLRAMAWAQKGSVLRRRRETETALEAFVAARRFAKSARDFRTRIVAEENIGACYARLGKIATAKKHLVHAIELARKHGDRPAEATWLLDLGSVEFMDGELDPAERLAAMALEIARGTDRYLTTFGAVWLEHKITVVRRPADPDRHRLAFLRRLFPRVKTHRGVDEIEEYKGIMIEGNRDRGVGDDVS